MRHFLLAALAASLSVAALDPGRPTLAVDFPSFLRDADLLYSWTAGDGPLDPLVPLAWSQSAYIGNGLVGAMVTALVSPTNATTALRVDVSRTDIWSCSQREPTGYLTVSPPSALARVDMRIELLTAQLHVNFSLASGDVVAFRLFVNAADPLGATGALALVVDSLPAAGLLGVTFTPDSSGPCSDKAPQSGSMPTAWGVTSYVTQTFPSGTATAAWTVLDAAAGAGQTVLLYVANSQRRAGNATASLGDALSGVAASHARTAAGLAADSAAWWASFWATSFFSFDSAGRPGVTKLEEFAHIAGYRYASAARFTMHDLMGPWGPSHASTCIGPWCQFCWDMNQQVMMYLPSPSNRGALLGAPAFDMLPALLDGSWGARYGSNPPSSATDILWFTAQAWKYCALHGDDARLLGTVLPLIKKYLPLGGLTNGPDGRLHLVGCYSPEYSKTRYTDCNYGLSILRWAAVTGEAIAAALAPSDPSLPLFRDVIARIAPFSTDATTGSWSIAAGVPFAKPHRHYSHLLMAYDLGVIGPADNATLAASLDVWFNLTCAGTQAFGPSFPGGIECRGFTQAAMSAMSTLLDRRDAALGNLTSFLTLVGLPNGMYGEEVYAGQPSEFSPVAESAFSAAASVYGLLLRSSAGSRSGAAAAFGGAVLRVWPAAPFANASFFRLRADGALLVSAVRVGGATAWVAVEADALADGESAATTAFTLAVEDWADVAALAVVAAPGVAAARVQPGVFAVTGLARGGAAAFAPAGAPPPDLRVGAAEGRNASEANAWGSRFAYAGLLP
jgi:alpha-L-fucosidase 2